MLAREIMTANPACATRDDNVQKAARMMRDLHCGAIPVVEDDRDKVVAGIVTDRDLALRVIAQGKPLDTPVGEVMSAGVSCCLPDTRVEDVEQIMAERQVRRVPVVDATGACIGIIALGDIARAAVTGQTIHDTEVGRIVEYVSSPTDAARADVDAGVDAGQMRRGSPQPEPWPDGSRAPRELRTRAAR